MQEIIEKRSALLNYFFNQSVDYSTEEILQREYAALNFSPREEYVDVFETGYENVLTSVTEIGNDMPEVLMKGIIVDVDMKKNYCIMHMQNKGDDISVSINANVLSKYGDYLQKGHLVLIKGHTYKGKLYMHFLIDYNVDNSFILEKNYLNGTSAMLVDEIDYTNRHDLVGLVKQATYFTSKKKKSCLRLEIHERGVDKTYITCKSPYNIVPNNITAGMIVSYNTSNNPTFINNVQEANL